MPWTLRTLVVAAVLVPLVACGGDDAGGDDASGDGSSYQQRIAEDLLADQSDGSLTFSAAEADCAAGRITDEISASRLKELGIEEGTSVEDLDFSTEERGHLFEAFDGCLDLAGQIATLLSAGGQLTEDEARCVAERYTESDEFREGVVAADPDQGLNDRIDAVLADAMAECAPDAG